MANEKEFLVLNQQMVTHDDLNRLKKEIESEQGKRAIREKTSDDTREVGKKALKALKKGFDNIAESMNTARTRRRPRISQLPDMKHLEISSIPDLSVLKHKNFRNRDIRGKKIG